MFERGDAENAFSRFVCSITRMEVRNHDQYHTLSPPSQRRRIDTDIKRATSSDRSYYTIC